MTIDKNLDDRGDECCIFEQRVRMELQINIPDPIRIAVEFSKFFYLRVLPAIDNLFWVRFFMFRLINVEKTVVIGRYREEPLHAPADADAVMDKMPQCA